MSDQFAPVPLPGADAIRAVLQGFSMSAPRPEAKPTGEEAPRRTRSILAVLRRGARGRALWSCTDHHLREIGVDPVRERLAASPMPAADAAIRLSLMSCGHGARRR